MSIADFVYVLARCGKPFRPRAFRDQYGNKITPVFTSPENAKAFAAAIGVAGYCTWRTATGLLVQTVINHPGKFFAIDPASDSEFGATCAAEFIIGLINIARRQGRTEKPSEVLTNGA